MPERRRTGSPKTAERLGRMLVIVPYLVRHPGSALPDVARWYDVPPDQLVHMGWSGFGSLTLAVRMRTDYLAGGGDARPF